LPAGRRAETPPRFDARPRGYGRHLMFVFFSNRLGCGGSLLVSAVVTLFLLLLLGVINLG
jgi:hypothetical protein